MLVQRLGAPSDLDPLLARVRDARVVLIGEATHGSSEYYRLREQLTRRLIAEQGFSFVAVEGDWPDCDRVNRSVTAAPGGATDPRHALEQFARWPTWMWANAEVDRFCRWLRTWNLQRPTGERAGFHGLDVYSLWESVRAIFDYLGEEDPRSLAAAQDAYRCFEPYGRRVEEYGAASRFVSARCEEEVVRLLARTREHAAADGPDAFAAWQNAEVVAGAERYYRAMVQGGPESWNVRDIHMTDTLDRLLDHYGPDSRGIVWAHNTHVGDARATDMAADGMINIGQLARERLGRDRVALVGFGSYRGTVIAAPRWGSAAESMVVPPAREGSLERRLHELMPERAVLVFGGPDQPEWATGTLDHRAIGVVYDPSYESWGNYVPTRLADRYDAFVWCDESSALHPLPARAASDEMQTYPAGV
ncbi:MULTISPECIES: erythromycin esterase family protein [unclassified Micromonospora]|uniref:erythromycin esterase family protein n=1 Tax=unclassified Micromonospora TaxID=2617518 RepID=UPI001053FB4D|nr:MULTISPECIES: erythromycin esterase family protein [unclassified Micromonospora]TDB79257.1 erythromycin esterase family protein [Micromonospora sp. KC721]TDC37869.1 erythromycin esterase family protein [Micromonospora sp. KC213]